MAFMALAFISSKVPAELLSSVPSRQNICPPDVLTEKLDGVMQLDVGLGWGWIKTFVFLPFSGGCTSIYGLYCFEQKRTRVLIHHHFDVFLTLHTPQDSNAVVSSKCG